MGAVVYVMHVYASMVVGTAYNGLFLVYVTLASASVSAFVMLFRSIDERELLVRFSPHPPRWFTGLFMPASGIVTLVVWMLPLAENPCRR
jgi:hypothetical protein